MHHHYKTTILLSVLISPLLATGQAMKPVAANDFSFNAFKLPPFPVEVMHVAPAPGGGVTLTTFMPIAGRTLPVGETPKPKGAVFPSNASYLQTLTLGPDAKPITTAPGSVFGQAPQPVGDVDWAVFGTNATDGPQRLPYGGDFGPGHERQMATRFPQMGIPAVLSVQPKLIDNGIGAGGKVHMAYPQRVAFLDPITGKLGIRAETPTPLAAESQRKTAGYSIPPSYRYVQPIQLANGQIEAIANQAAEGDKNAIFRQFHMLRYDNGGNLLQDSPVQFGYNRNFFPRCPLVDGEGRVVGAVNIFGDGDGKKEFLDPEENRIGVVVTDEQGAIWAQFDWTVNGSSVRAAEPLLARREGETVKLWTFNTQKMLKPQYESWTWTRDSQTVKTAFSHAVTEMGLYDLSVKLGLVNNGATPGWYYPSQNWHLTSFTDEKATTWVVTQRVTSAYDNGTLTRRVFGDLFVQQFDAQLKLQKQTIVAMEDKGEPARLEQLLRYPDGAAYALMQGNETGMTTIPAPSAKLSPIQCVY